MVFLAILIAILLIGMLILLIRLRREAEHQRLLVDRFRKSGIYDKLYPTLASCRRSTIEQITVRPEELMISVMPPDRKTLRFRFDRVLGEALTPETQYALTQSLAVDFSGLGDRKKYVFRTNRDVRPDGTRCVWYSYTLRTSEKDNVLRGVEAQERERKDTRLF